MLIRICGDVTEDHKRKVDTNHLVYEFNQLWEDLFSVSFSKRSSTVKKKIKERRQVPTVNNVFCYSLNADNLGWILTLQVRQQAKKAPDA